MFHSPSAVVLEQQKFPWGSLSSGPQSQIYWSSETNIFMKTNPQNIEWTLLLRISGWRIALFMFQGLVQSGFLYIATIVHHQVAVHSVGNNG